MFKAIYFEKRKEVWSDSLPLLTYSKSSEITSCLRLLVYSYTEYAKQQQGFGALLRFTQATSVTANTSWR